MDVHIAMHRTLSPVEFGPEAMLASYSGDIVRSEDGRQVGRARALVADIERARAHGYGALDFLDVDGSSWPYHALLSLREAGTFNRESHYAAALSTRAAQGQFKRLRVFA